MVWCCPLSRWPFSSRATSQHSYLPHPTQDIRKSFLHPNYNHISQERIWSTHSSIFFIQNHIKIFTLMQLQRVGLSCTTLLSPSRISHLELGISFPYFFLPLNYRTLSFQLLLRQKSWSYLLAQLVPLPLLCLSSSLTFPPELEGVLFPFLREKRLFSHYIFLQRQTSPSPFHSFS